MRIEKAKALSVFREAVALAECKSQGDPLWYKWICEFSELCENTSKTHIAFLGTAMLAKAVNLKADAFSVKAGDDSLGAYSARGLAHSVLVPNAPRYDVNLGVTGREPLNNQPYFRISRVTSEMPVKRNTEHVLSALLGLLAKLNKIDSTEFARKVLVTFIVVRKQYNLSYELIDPTCSKSKDELIHIIHDFVRNKSEGGRRAQAVVAGILDIYAGIERVISGRINDPDKHLPGDVGIKSRHSSLHWEKVFEVRDKVVTKEDVYLFVQKVVESKVREAAIISVKGSPPAIGDVIEWAKKRGVAITLFSGWAGFVGQVLFWAEPFQGQGLELAPRRIQERLIEIEVSSLSVEEWTAYFG